MADDYVASTPRHGNGHDFPISRRAFVRGLPRRVGAIEDQLEGHESRLDDLVCRVTEIEARPATRGFDPALTARVDNLVEIVGRLAEQVRRIDTRSSQSRRKLAVIADQL